MKVGHIVFIAVALLLIICSLVVYVFSKADGHLAPGFTSTFAFNEKVGFLRAVNGHRDVVAIGSSMALNNLSSEVMQKRFGDSFLNAGVQSIKVSTMADFLPILEDKYSPNTVILVTNTMDLLPNRFEIPVPKIERYLNPHIPAVLSYLDRWQPAYYITAINMLEETRDNGTHFSSLAYDRWGGVPLVDEGFHRDHRRFNAPAFTRLDHDQLNALQRMISQSHVQHFVVILTPYRQGVIQDSTKRTKLDSSIATLRETVEEAGGVFIDTTTVPWPDSLYHDSSHMRQSGAYKLTQFALKALDETTNPSSR
jgi:hypothetical protein